MTDGYNTVVDGELLKWEKEGVAVEGLLQRYTQKPDTGKGVGHVYEVKTKNGVAAFFAPQLLQKKLENLPIGSIVKITFTNTTKTAVGNPLKHFDVGFIKPEEAMFSTKLKELGLEGYNKVADEVSPTGAQALVDELNAPKLDDGAPM